MNSTMHMMLKFMMGNAGAQGSPMQQRSSSSSMIEDPSLTIRPLANEDQVPNDAGGLPGVLQAPKSVVDGNDKMAKIRKDIDAAVKKQKNKKKSKTPSSDDDDDDDDDDDEDEDAAVKPKAKSKPKSKSKKATTGPKPKKASKGPKPKKASKEVVKLHDWQKNPSAVAILKRPAAAKRPAFAKTPTKHAGGKIYFSKLKKAFRVFHRIKDRIESTVPVLENEKTAFKYSCALIESDPRP